MNREELKVYKPKYRDGNIYMTDNDIEHCIMYGDEELYIKESIRQILKKTNAKSVRELGYGLGFTAQAFQDYGIETHIIYEPNDYIFKKAEKWAKNKDGVTVVNARFEDASNDKKVDLIYNDIYGMCNPDYQMANLEEVREAFNFDWYTEFCVDYVEAEGVPEYYFRFQIGGHDKIQLIVKNNANNL